MSSTRRILTSAFVSVIVLLWLGFALHRAPRFAGTLQGGLFGMAGTLLMTFSLLYPLIKRVPSLKRRITPHVSKSTLLTLHVYSGLFGPLLALIHTGHKFDSPLAIAMTASMLGVVASGYAGHILLLHVTRDAAEQRRILAGLEGSYRYYTAELRARPEQRSIVRLYSRLTPRVAARLLGANAEELATPARILGVVESMADVEYGIKTNQLFRRLFTGWLRVHVALTVVLFALIALHVWAEIHFGLRWQR